jgi:hypothetical protein
MSLENKSCDHCNKSLEDGDILLKNENKLLHYSVPGNVPPLMAILSCSMTALDEGKVGVFYKEKFYDLEKNSDKLSNINVSFKDKTNEKGIIYGHILVGNISFLDNLNPD